MYLITVYTANACDPSGQCSPYQFGKKEGNLCSPHFPDLYTHDLRCFYFIGGPDTKQIQLTFNTIRMEPRKDFLKIGLGSSAGLNAQIEYDIDDRITPIPPDKRTVVFEAEKLWIYLSTDYSILNQGFNISYILGKLPDFI